MRPHWQFSHLVQSITVLAFNKLFPRISIAFLDTLVQISFQFIIYRKTPGQLDGGYDETSPLIRSWMNERRASRRDTSTRCLRNSPNHINSTKSRWEQNCTFLFNFIFFNLLCSFIPKFTTCFHQLSEATDSSLGFSCSDVTHAASIVSNRCRYMNMAIGSVTVCYLIQCKIDVTDIDLNEHLWDCCFCISFKRDDWGIRRWYKLLSASSWF